MVRRQEFNKATVEDLSRFQCLFPNPNWLVWKSIPPPKTRRDKFSTGVRVESCKVSPPVWLSTLKQTPTLA